MDRRLFIKSSAVTVLASHFPALTACDELSNITNSATALNLLDFTNDGRLGVSVYSKDTSYDIYLHNNQAVLNIDATRNEHFAMCSTFKLPLAAMILHEIDQGRIAADEPIPIKESDILGYAPVTKEHLDQGYMSIMALAEAAQKTSDNTAANLLLPLIGGPKGFTQNMRNMGDNKTRLDRIEPHLNLVPAGELRDTTTPYAMARSLSHIFEGNYLSDQSRARLKQWMVDTQTGLKHVRAGLPKDWIAGDKTGTGIAPSMANKHNDIGVIWPPNRNPIYYAAFYEADAHYNQMRPQDDAILADVGRVIAKKNDPS